MRNWLPLVVYGLCACAFAIVFENLNTARHVTLLPFEIAAALIAIAFLVRQVGNLDDAIGAARLDLVKVQSDLAKLAARLDVEK